VSGFVRGFVRGFVSGSLTRRLPEAAEFTNSAGTRAVMSPPSFDTHTA